MKIDEESYFDRVIKAHQILWEDGSVTSRVSRLAKRMSLSDGQCRRLGELDYDRDICALEEWFVNFWKSAEIGDVRGIWFGMFRPFKNNEHTTYDFCCNSSMSFELDDALARWTDPIVEGSDYANCDILDQFYRLDHDLLVNKNSDFDSEHMGLGYLMIAIDSILGKRAKGLFGEQDVGVGIGWNAGSPVYIGTVVKGEWILRSREDIIEGEKLMRIQFEAG